VGTLEVVALPDWSMDPGAVYQIVTATELNGFFGNAVPDTNGFAYGVTSNGLTFDVQYTDTSVLLFNVVPAPGAATLAGLVGAVAVRRRRSRA